MYTDKEFSKLSWEYIEQNSKALRTTTKGDYIRRAKVHGGWLVESAISGATTAGCGFGIGLTFIPDTKHRWNVELE